MDFSQTEKNKKKLRRSKTNNKNQKLEDKNFEEKKQKTKITVVKWKSGKESIRR